MRMPARFAKEAVAVKSQMNFEADAHRSIPGFIGVPFRDSPQKSAATRPVLGSSATQQHATPQYSSDMVDGWNDEIKDLVLNKGFHYEMNSKFVPTHFPLNYAEAPVVRPLSFLTAQASRLRSKPRTLWAHPTTTPVHPHANSLQLPVGHFLSTVPTAALE